MLQHLHSHMILIQISGDWLTTTTLQSPEITCSPFATFTAGFWPSKLTEKLAEAHKWPSRYHAILQLCGIQLMMPTGTARIAAVNQCNHMRLHLTTLLLSSQSQSSQSQLPLANKNYLYIPNLECMLYDIIVYIPPWQEFPFITEDLISRLMN